MEKRVVKGGGKREIWHDLVKFMRLMECLAVYLLMSIALLTKKY